MQHIDERRLEEETPYRFQYLCEFMGFDDDDIALIHASAEKLAPMLPGMVDAAYVKLLSCDATARHFLPRQHGFEGEVPTSLESLSVDDAQIQFRKEHLIRYLTRAIAPKKRHFCR